MTYQRRRTRVRQFRGGGVWTLERRQAMSERQRRRWEEASPEQREAWKANYAEARAKAKETYRQNYPERAQLIDQVKEAIEDGSVVPDPCAYCGTTERVVADLDYSTSSVTGWSCWGCRDRLWKCSRCRHWSTAHGGSKDEGYGCEKCPCDAFQTLQKAA